MVDSLNIGGIIVIECRQYGCHRDPSCWDDRFRLIQKIRIQACLAIAVEKPKVRQEMTAQQFLLRNDVKRPSFSLCELAGYGQLALDLWLGEQSRRLDFHKPFGMIRHLDQEIRHDVAVLPAITAFSAVRWRTVEEFNLDVVLQLLPCIPDRQGLLLDVENLGTSHERCSRGPFELTLAADRSALLRTGYQQKRAGRAAPKAERGDVGRIVGIGHQERSCCRWRERWAQAALRRLRVVPELVRAAAGRLLPLEPFVRRRLVGRSLA